MHRHSLYFFISVILLGNYFYEFCKQVLYSYLLIVSKYNKSIWFMWPIHCPSTRIKKRNRDSDSTRDSKYSTSDAESRANSVLIPLNDTEGEDLGMLLNIWFTHKYSVPWFSSCMCSEMCACVYIRYTYNYGVLTYLKCILQYMRYITACYVAVCFVQPQKRHILQSWCGINLLQYLMEYSIEML